MCRVLCPRAGALYVALLACAIVALSCSAVAADVSRQFVGERVGDVLDNLHPQGLTFIYSTSLVPPDLRVKSEPSARNGLALAEEILAAHGLGLSQAAPGVFAVVSRATDVTRKRREMPRTSPDGTALEEVTVQTSRYTLRSELVSEALLTHEDIRNLPSLAEEPLRAVQRLPGVASNGFSSLGLVRGGGPGETGIVLDGLRLYEPFHLKNFLSPVSLLDSRWIQDMQVSSGGFPVLQGDRMSSIIDASTLAPDQPRYYEAGLSLFHTNLLASSHFDDDRGRGLVSLRRSNLGDLAHLSENDFGTPEYFDGFGKISYRLSDTTRLSGDLLASSDRILAIRHSGIERANADYRNTYLWGTLEHDWGSGARTRVIVSYTDVSNERYGRVEEQERRTGQVRDMRNFHVIGLRADHEFNMSQLEHRVGVEARRLWGRYDYRSDARFEAGFPFPESPATEMHRFAAPKPDGFELGAWWDSRINVNDRWTVEAGLRIDTQTYDASSDDEQIAPRLNVMYRLGDATRLRGSWGRFWQSQGINELQVEDDVEHFYSAQRVDHLILSFDHAFADGLELRIEAYRKDYNEINPRFENLFNPLVLLPEMEFDRERIAPTSARSEGIEGLLRWEPSGSWRAWLGYTWSQVNDSIDGRMVARSWDQKHAINAGIRWVSGPWSVTVTDSFHAGWPITRLKLAEGADGAVRPVIGERNAERLHDYNSLDLRLARTFVLTRGVLDVFFEATNLLGRENECCLEYTVTRTPDGAVVLQEEPKHWLPLVPSLGAVLEGGSLSVRLGNP